MPEVASWMGSPSIKGSSEPVRMALLTFSLIGLQFTWGIEMTYCTPYLLQLGLTKSMTSLVWIAGPVSGLIMQPVVGILADRSRSKWGRRRPFMIGGSLIVCASLLTLGWTREIVGLFVEDPATKSLAAIVVAVLSIYLVDFAINAVQSSCRSLIVDTLPIPQQQAGSAWASRMSSFGHLIGYGAGTIDLVKVFGTTLGDSQFKQMTVIAAAGLLIAVAVTCYAVEERVLISVRNDGKGGVFKMMAEIFRTTVHLPPRIQAICWAQFWAWIGWFPFLFYGATWVGEIWRRYDAPSSAAESKDALGDIGRIASLCLVVFSIVTFISSVLLPFLIRSPEEYESVSSNGRLLSPHRPPPPILPEWLEKLKPDLVTGWLISHVLFASSMVFAPVVTSVHGATFLVAMCGIPWAVSCWAPFAFMGVEINRLGISSPSAANGHAYTRLSTESVELVEMPPSSPTTLRLNHAPEPPSGTGELAGIYLGVLNVYTVLPQFVATFVSTVVFHLLEPGKSPELADDVEKDQNGKNGPNAIAVCLFIGALSAVVAAVATRRLKYVQ